MKQRPLRRTTIIQDMFQHGLYLQNTNMKGKNEGLTRGSISCMSVV
jgi:hypothetical protein